MPALGLQAASPQNAVKCTGQAVLLAAAAGWKKVDDLFPGPAAGSLVYLLPQIRCLSVCRRVFFKECTIENPGLFMGL